MKFKLLTSKKFTIQFLAFFFLLSIVVSGLTFYIFSENLKEYFYFEARTEISNVLKKESKALALLPLQSICSEFHLSQRVRLTIIDQDGSVLCDTLEKDFDNHKNRPEILAAQFSTITYANRYSQTLKQDLVYGAIKVKKDQSWLILRAAIPVISIENILAQIYRNTLLKIIPVLLVFLLIFSFIFYRYSEQVSTIIRKLKSLEHGNDQNNKSYSRLQNLENIIDQVDTQLEQNVRTLRLEVDKSSPLLQSISDGVLALDYRKNILFYNLRLARFFEYSKITPNNIDDLLPRVVTQLFSDCLHNGEEHKLYNFKIDQKIIDITVTPIFDDENRIMGAIGIFRNITEKKQAEQIRIDFVANVSHELKTPLTSIKGFAQLLLENESAYDEKTRKYLGKILVNSEKLIALFEDLLTLSHVESEKELKVEAFDLLGHIKEIVDYLKSKNPKKNIVVVKNLEVKTLSVNPKLFRQVVFNILENAIKYSHENVNIYIESTIQDQQVRLSFKDDGVGISVDKMHRVFERFYRANESRSDSTKGSGIGLAIVKHIIHKHSGSITVNSLEKGTVFEITIPLKS